MSSTHKKIVVRKTNRDSISGYVGSSFLVEGSLEFLNTDGKVVRIALGDVKAVYFVREWGDAESVGRKTFATRPRQEGLWVRLRFRDNEVMEGIMPNNLAQEVAEGFLFNPPDTRSNTQRIFVPRSALTELKVLAVIGAAQRRKRPVAPDARQVSMFEQ